MTPWSPGAAFAGTFAVRAAAATMAVTSAEYLARRSLFRDGGALSWPVSRLGARWLCSGWTGRASDLIFRYPNVLGLVALRLALSIAVILWPQALVLEAFLVIAVVAFLGRSRYGLDGADQLAAFVLISHCLLSALGGGSPGGDSAFSVLLTIQMALCYATAGLWKLRSGTWRDGTAMPLVAGTQVYGSKQLFAILQRAPALSVLASWGVIVWESSFPLVVFLPGRWAAFYLLGGGALHASIALFMGLNDFLLVFVGTYPAVMFTRDLVARHFL